MTHTRDCIGDVSVVLNEGALVRKCFVTSWIGTKEGHGGGPKRWCCWWKVMRLCSSNWQIGVCVAENDVIKNW